jgi:hypothetical protein
MRIVALMCVLLVGVPSISQNEPLGVNGVVLTPDGKPIEGVFVLIRDYQRSGSQYVSDRWEGRTAADGGFSFAAPKGCYDILVSGNYGVLPFAQRVCIPAQHPALRIKLKADPHPLLLVH